jgi:hypothetical protein
MEGLKPKIQLETFSFDFIKRFETSTMNIIKAKMDERTNIFRMSAEERIQFLSTK